MADFLPGRGCAQANFSQFLRRENAQMAAFLRRCLEVGDRGRTIEQIRDGKAKPSQQLADAVERMLKGNTEFELIDEQKVVDEKALALALALARHLREGRHCVLLVPGGPGTGKSVVAVVVSTWWRPMGSRKTGVPSS
jgi:DNA replication protein DnaC